MYLNHLEPDYYSYCFNSLKIISLKKEISPPSFNIVELLNKRKSAKLPIQPQKKINIDQLSKLIKLSFGLKNDENKRVYPSGGEKYPNHLFLLVYDIEGLESGSYYYDPNKHSLIEIETYDNEEIEESKKNFVSDYQNVNCMFFIVYDKDRNQLKYDNLGYQLALLEAGHIGQNFSLIGEYMKLQVRCSLSFDANKIEKILKINSISDVVIYSILIAG